MKQQEPFKTFSLDASKHEGLYCAREPYYGERLYRCSTYTFNSDKPTTIVPPYGDTEINAKSSTRAHVGSAIFSLKFGTSVLARGEELYHLPARSEECSLSMDTMGDLRCDPVP